MTAAAPSPSVAALRARFGDAVLRDRVICGDTIVWVSAARAHDILAWLRDDPAQGFDFLTDVTAVEYRDGELPLEVVYQLRSLKRRADLRVKLELDKALPLEVESVCDLWAGANWLEREVFDMFGITFRNHPDLRRILMWETYSEGHPLRKSFPLRGHRSRAEQTKADTEFLARELASLRLAVGEVATRDYLRRELEEIKSLLADLGDEDTRPSR